MSIDEERDVGAIHQDGYVVGDAKALVDGAQLAKAYEPVRIECPNCGYTFNPPLTSGRHPQCEQRSRAIRANDCEPHATEVERTSRSPAYLHQCMIVAVRRRHIVEIVAVRW